MLYLNTNSIQYRHTNNTKLVYYNFCQMGFKRREAYVLRVNVECLSSICWLAILILIYLRNVRGYTNSNFEVVATSNKLSRVKILAKCDRNIVKQRFSHCFCSQKFVRQIFVLTYEFLFVLILCLILRCYSFSILIKN